MALVRGGSSRSYSGSAGTHISAFALLYGLGLELIRGGQRAHADLRQAVRGRRRGERGQRIDSYNSVQCKLSERIVSVSWFHAEERGHVVAKDVGDLLMGSAGQSNGDRRAYRTVEPSRADDRSSIALDERLHDLDRVRGHLAVGKQVAEEELLVPVLVRTSAKCVKAQQEHTIGRVDSSRTA